MDLNSLQSIYDQSKGASDAAQSSLAQFQGSMKDPLSYYTDAYNNLGVAGTQGNMNTAQEAVAKTNNLLNALPQTVQGQVNGTFTNEAQRQSLLADEAQPLTAMYNTQQNNYNTFSNQYKNLLDQAANQANLGYTGQQQKFSTLEQLYGNAFGQQQQAQTNLQQARQYMQQQAAIAAQVQQMNAQTQLLKQQFAQQQAQWANMQALYSQTPQQQLANQKIADVATYVHNIPTQQPIQQAGTAWGNPMSILGNFGSSLFSHIPGIGSLPW